MASLSHNKSGSELIQHESIQRESCISRVTGWFSFCSKCQQYNVLFMTKNSSYSKYSRRLASSGLDIKHLVYMPIGHVVLKIYVPWKGFHVPSQYLYKPCKAYVYCWKNKYMPTLKNHMPCRACNHKSLCALGQDLHAPGMRARLNDVNVEPCFMPWVEF